MPVHLFGRCADMDPILEATARHGIPVIEDAAQALGARDANGRHAGSMATVGCFSFFPSKNLGGFGDGGLVATNDEKLAKTIRVLRVHGSDPKYYHRLVGGNFRLDALQAAVLRVKLNYLPAWNDARRRHAATYRRLFQEKGPLHGVVLPEDTPNHIYNQFVGRFPTRDRLRDFLRTRGVETEIYYPVPLPYQECFAALGHARGEFPRAASASAESLALPVYPELTDAQQCHVVDAIYDYYRES
jgi:dTDP-4-amino-4,6-dideoxygalactose transaminase